MTEDHTDETSTSNKTAASFNVTEATREPIVQRALGRLRGETSMAFEIVKSGDLIPDSRLAPGSPDLLQHEAIAKSVAEISLRADTPVNIALFGAWGSGKSSIYTMIRGHLKSLAGDKVTVVRYDAWKYGGKELKRNFVDSLAESLEISDPELREGMHRPLRTVKLNFSGWFKGNWRQLIVGVVLATLGVLAFGLALAAATAAVSDSTMFRQAFEEMLPRTGTVLGPIILALVLAPKVLDGVSVTNENPAPEEGDQFAQRFRKLIKVVRKGSDLPLVVFIDELDRCAPDEVVSTLRDLKTFLDEPGCVFIVAADREVIVRALRLEVAQARPVQGEEPYYATPGAYLDKIFQHQIALPPLRARALTTFAQTLADQQEDGVWAELRECGVDVYQRVIFGLVPVHVRSPRRVKVLMNNFATNARVAQARGMDWLDRSDEIAVLTVLQTEFPEVVVSLRRVPKLLSYLRGERTESAEVRAIVAKHQYADDVLLPGPATPEDDPSGVGADGTSDEILNDSTFGSEEALAARSTLRRQLSSYLSKVAATPMHDPRPDLLYLRPAARRELLPEPALGDAIDFASDTAPAQTVAAFEDQSSSVLAIAIPLIVLEGEQGQGMGRRFAYEAASRLVEQLDPQDYPGVSSDASAALTSALVQGELSDDSTPGALLLASVAGSDEVQRALSRALPGDVLKRVAALASHFSDEETAIVAAACAENFVGDPEAFIALLDGAEVADAVDFWHASETKVVKFLNEVELPKHEEPATPPAANSRQQPAATPEPTGDGIALVERLLESVRARTDGEALVSAVYASFQERPAVSPFVQWTHAHRDEIVAPMSDPLRRAEHALRGIRAFTAGSWAGWANLLPETGASVSDGVAEIATDVLRRKLLPAFFKLPEDITRSVLATVTLSVSAWCELDDETVADTLRSRIQEVEWTADDAWESRLTLYPLLAELCSCEDPKGPLPEIVLADVAKAPTQVAVDDDFVELCFDLVSKLPASWRRAAVDALQQQEESIDGDEAAPWLLLVLHLRKLIGQGPVGADRLRALTEVTADLATAWLALAPQPAEVVSVLGEVSVTTSALSGYASGLDDENRTELWMAAERAGLPDQQVAAVGRYGVGAAAVTHVEALIRQKTRQPERHATIQRLISGKSVSNGNSEVRELRRAAGDLASYLLDQSQGDLRAAAELMIWAGGSTPKGDQALRGKFNAAIEAGGKNALTRRATSDLQELQLLSKKRSIMEKVFGS